jgi:uncharacterized protein YbcI
VAEYQEVFRHVGFFCALTDVWPPFCGGLLEESQYVTDSETQIAEELAQIAAKLQLQRTGHAPKAVTVVLSDDTLVVTLHEALTNAEKALAQSREGAAQVQEFHRQLFSTSTDDMRHEIERITGRKVREAAGEVEPITGAVVHAFTTGAMVQVYLLMPQRPESEDHAHPLPPSGAAA